VIPTLRNTLMRTMLILESQFNIAFLALHSSPSTFQVPCSRPPATRCSSFMQTFPCNALMCTMLILEPHFNIAFLAPHSSPSAIQCLSHVPQPAIIAHRALSISRKFAFSIIDHLMQASRFASMNVEVVVYAEGRRKMKKSPRTRPSSAHLYLTSAHTS